MVDNGICMRCSLVALAEVLDQFSGIEHYSGTAVGLNLQKLWINLTESSVMMALEWRFGWPDGVELALELRFGRPDSIKLALERYFRRPGDAKIALERRFGRPGGAKASSWHWNGDFGSRRLRPTPATPKAW